MRRTLRAYLRTQPYDTATRLASASLVRARCAPTIPLCTLLQYPCSSAKPHAAVHMEPPAGAVLVGEVEAAEEQPFCASLRRRAAHRFPVPEASAKGAGKIPLSRQWGTFLFGAPRARASSVRSIERSAARAVFHLCQF